MKVSEAVDSRRSVRAFLSRPVDAVVLRDVLARAARAPSGGNVQPWKLYVLAGEALDGLRRRMDERLFSGPTSEAADYDIYPANLWEPHRSARYQVGEEMYALLGVGREDKVGRMRQFQRNYQFFGAPAALFCYVDRRMGKPQWSDLGMYLQTVMLLLREHGLHSCAQECWSVYPQTVGDYLGAPAEWMLFCGMAIGHADDEAPVNRLRTTRVPLDDFAEFRGF